MRKLTDIFFGLFAAGMLLSAFLILKTWYKDYKEEKYWQQVAEKKEERMKFEESHILPEYQALYKQNTDLIGWIKIENTKIDYPVMQTKEEPEYYLRRNFNKELDNKGTPFMDYRCESLSRRSFNVIIYGHYTNSDSMFRWLLNYASKSWYEENKQIQFDSLTEKGTYEVVAVFYYDATNAVLENIWDEKKETSYEFYNYIELDNAEGYQKFAEKIKERKLYETESDFDEMDKLLTLVCCAPEGYSGIKENGRFVVMAKEI